MVFLSTVYSDIRGDVAGTAAAAEESTSQVRGRGGVGLAGPAWEAH